MGISTGVNKGQATVCWEGSCRPGVTPAMCHRKQMICTLLTPPLEYMLHFMFCAWWPHIWFITWISFTYHVINIELQILLTLLRIDSINTGLMKMFFTILTPT